MGKKKPKPDLTDETVQIRASRKQIRISEKILHELEKNAKPFETMGEVLERLLLKKDDR